MTDPSIEAVKNAAGENHWWITRLDDQTIANVCEYAEAAAREMAKSVRLSRSLFPNSRGLIGSERRGAFGGSHD